MNNKLKRANWDGNDITVSGVLSYKLDGICCIIDRKLGKCISRNGNELLHTDAIYNTYKYTNVLAGEIFYNDFKTTISSVKTHGNYQISVNQFYPHTPATNVDSRLFIREVSDEEILYSDVIQSTLEDSIQTGYEGLVFQSYLGNIIKIKKSDTYDVLIEDIIEGEGRNKGKLGAFVTNRGNVGTGLTDSERIEYFTKDLIGSVIEVTCMEVTKNGKFRHSRFIRLRTDKLPNQID